MKISLEEFLHKFSTTFPPAIVGIPTHYVVDITYEVPFQKLCDCTDMVLQDKLTYSGLTRGGGEELFICRPPPAVNLLKMLIV